jgi:hypothetical protein
VAVLGVATTVMFSVPVGPIQWCDPASPLFDPTVCYNDGGPHSGYACDSFSDAYNADYCAAQH